MDSAYSDKELLRKIMEEGQLKKEEFQKANRIPLSRQQIMPVVYTKSLA